MEATSGNWIERNSEFLAWKVESFGLSSRNNGCLVKNIFVDRKHQQIEYLE